MVGSLDCMQTKWKNCPLGWQQSFKGQSKGMSTIVLEAACDYNLWFWHAAYGFSGALNDSNILSLSPLLDRMTNGSFIKLERQSKVVPFFIEGEEHSFNNTYFLVDGIYPRYTRFVKALPHPFGEEEERFTAWQEGARKDIERAFGVLQCRFKAIAAPIHFMDQDCIYSLVTTYLIAHNICVQEKIAESCTLTSDPSVEMEAEEQPAPHSLHHPPPVIVEETAVDQDHNNNRLPDPSKERGG